MGGKASLPRNRCPLLDKKWMNENLWKDKLKTKYFCSACQLNFCFIEDRNDFLRSGIQRSVTTTAATHRITRLVNKLCSI